jgi:lactate racemase
MQVSLSFGKGHLQIKVPDHSQVLTGKNIIPLSQPQEAIQKSLTDPIGTPALSDIINQKKPKSVCIVVSDHTRPVPNKLILPPLLNELNRAGISSPGITILLANGMHRKTTLVEKGELVGQDILDTYRVIDHKSRDTNALYHFTINNIPATVNRLYHESDLKIITGFIEPHFMAGFSGGRKAICPGISGFDTVKYFHSPKLLESPFASPGNLNQNPCHEFATAVAKKVGVDFMVNVTINCEKQITGIFSGDLEKAYAAGVNASKQQSLVKVENPFDIVITTNGGYPLDRDLYQTVKGLVGALEIVKEGGTILCATECCDGVGSTDFRQLLFEMQDPASFIRMISEPGYFQCDQWEVEELVKVLKKVQVQLYTTGLSVEEIKRSHLQPISSIETGIRRSLKRYGKNASIAIIPEGPYVLAKLAI